MIQAKADKLLAQEEIWIRKGVEARRTRAQARIVRLQELRAKRQARRDAVGSVNMDISSGAASGKLVAELTHVSKTFGERRIVDDFSATILRGDKIGLLGPNGAGKTTLLKLILGELKADPPPAHAPKPEPGHSPWGTVRQGANLSVAYFDQMRNALDLDATLEDFISPGSEWIEIGNQRKHVKSYLGDFLFSPARATSPVRSLSGGERNRLLLARLFARPANVLVLDEPTNDLDMETLDLLEQLLQDYDGTVLLVSHDRALLREVCDQFWLVADGALREFDGDLDDYQRWLQDRARQQQQSQRDGAPAGAPRQQDRRAAAVLRQQAAPLKKEMDGLDKRLAQLGGERAALEAELSQPTVGRIKLKNHDILAESKKWQKKKQEAGWACLHWPPNLRPKSFFYFVSVMKTPDTHPPYNKPDLKYVASQQKLVFTQWLAVIERRRQVERRLGPLLFVAQAAPNVRKCDAVSVGQ